MQDVTKTPYADFLEMLCKNVVKHRPEKIAVVMQKKDGSTYTAAYGDCGPFDLMAMASAMQADAMLDIVMANARDIIEAAEEDEDDG
jgi:hypothetical protein